jgi:hypothetical protein
MNRRFLAPREQRVKKATLGVRCSDCFHTHTHIHGRGSGINAHAARNFIYWHAGYQFRLELPRRPWSMTRVITLAARKHSFAEQQELFYLSLWARPILSLAESPRFSFAPLPAAVPPICILARPNCALCPACCTPAPTQ